MNPQSPREEIEIRITALLMGELSPDEAAALEKQIAADAELTALHARLQRAAGFVREASAFDEKSAHLAPSQPAQLSAGRRARLLALFKGAAPVEQGPVVVMPRRDWKWAVPLGLAASLMALLGGAMFVNGFGLRKGTRNIEKVMASSDSRDDLNYRSNDKGVETYDYMRNASLADTSRDERASRQQGRRADPSRGQNAADGLAKSAVSVVEEQVRRAGVIENGKWASQPGMIRVPPSSRTGFDSEKLYGYIPRLAAKDATKTDSEIDKSRLALTANSPSPELNLFGRPRTSNWPAAPVASPEPPRPDVAAAAPTPKPPGASAVYLPTTAEAPVLDLFSMPIASAGGAGEIGPRSDGYTISEPYSAAGKVNITSKLKPFPYARNAEDGAREPALRAGPGDATNKSEKGGKAADFDTGLGRFPDGAFAGKADEGNVSQRFFSDVNAPAELPGGAGIASAGGVKRYPIFDPAVATVRLPENDEKGSRQLEGLEGSDARTAGRTDLNGFSVTTGSVLGTGGVTKNGNGTLVLSGNSSYTGGTTVTAGTLQNRAADTDADKALAKLGGLHPVKPDKERADGNPAFYAGSFWETPRVQTYFDRGSNVPPEGYRGGVSSSQPAQNEFDFQAGVTFNFDKFALRGGLASSQPTQNEFQRHPGHPSTTSLGSVDLLPNVDLYALAPRPDQSGTKNATDKPSPDPSAPAALTMLGDSNARSNSELRLPDSIGPVRIDYGIPISETLKSNTGNFQFNEGYKYGGPGDPSNGDDTSKLNINHGNPLPAALAGERAVAPTAESAPKNVDWMYLAEGGRVTKNGPVSGKPGDQKSDGERNGEGDKIAGRLAFWSDDDTAKVNVAAAGGVVLPQEQPPVILAVGANNSVTFGGVISGSGDVTLSGNGVSQLNKTNAFTGGITLNGSTLQVTPTTPSQPVNGGGAGNINYSAATDAPEFPKKPAEQTVDVVNQTSAASTFKPNAPKPEPETAGNRKGALGIDLKGGTTFNIELQPAPDGAVAGKADDAARPLNEPRGSTEAAANRELARRMSRETSGKMETEKGRTSLQSKDYEAAFSHFKNAAENIPEGAPASEESRKSAVKGFAEAGVKLAEERAAEGYYASAAQALQEVLKQDPNSQDAQRLLSNIEAPEYFNKQTTPQHRQKVEEVKDAMVEAKGYTDLGRYDLADRKYQEIITRDPYNAAARTGREEVANLKMRTARAGYDATRAIAMWEVEKESAQPAARSDDEQRSRVEQLERQRERLKDLKPDDLMESVQNLGISDPALERTLPLLQDAKGEEAKLLSAGIGDPLKPDRKGQFVFDREDPRAAGAEQTKEQRLEIFDYIRRAHLKDTTRDRGPDVETRLAEVAANPQQSHGINWGGVVGSSSTPMEAGRNKDTKPEEKKVEEQRKLKDPEPAAPKPAPNPLVPQPEVRTGENAFSTFSLNVSDVAFKLAAASLERGAMPDVSTLRTEEFINAFDYRDPEAAPGAPLAFTSERARYPFAQNRDLLRLSVKTAAAGRQPGKPLNVVLLLDNSGSMERADRVRIVRESLRTLSAQLQPQDKLSIVTFSRTPRLWADGVAGDKAGEATARVGEITPEGGTNLAAALDLGYKTALRHYQVGSINHVVLLTDGAANLGDVDPAALKQKVEAHRKQGIALDCFGIGWEGLNDDMLEQLSRNGDGRYGFINTPEEAATNFAGQLAGALRVAASDVKVQVEFNPKRVTAYRQVGYAKHQLTKEQFRDNSVDAAELAAAESGNALYVIEVNPRGEGDLATVRVRFKVPGTSDYREHEWAVPFTRPAAPLEQSSSSLRLAASAAAFSEMLAGSPYATEVTSDRLLQLVNGLPAIYGADPRPKKLEWMIRQAKSLSGR